MRTRRRLVGIAAQGSTLAPLLIVFAGESNSGGLAPNSSATTPELAARNLKILNNTTLASFDALHIGTNNLTGHIGLGYAAATAHGWELELANRYDSGTFGARPVYLVKAGQGGSTVAMWSSGATYTAESTTVQPYNTFISRTQAAQTLVAAIHGVQPEVKMLWSLGINDMAINTSAATWKIAQKAVFNLMRSSLAIPLPIYMMRLEFVSANPYATQISEIASELSNITVIPSTGLTNIGDGYHLDYAGAKAWADGAINALVA